MIKIENLTRAYGDFIAVNNVSFCINAGEIVGLLGHNGAGKTTIMKMLSGYLEPSEGFIEVGDIDLRNDRVAVQKRLGYLPENLPVYPEMTVADYLDYAAHLKGLTGTVCTQEVRRVIKSCDITSKLLAPIATLSRGYKQRVGVAQALLGNPKLLILDEPTNGLDPTQTRQMRELIKEIAKEATVILSTHIMQEVDAICDRVLIMRSGELAIDSKLESLRKSNHLVLSSDLPETHAEGLLRPVPHIESVRMIAKQNGVVDYRLNITEGEDLQATSAEIAKVLVNSDYKLFGLSVAHRDLETVFREVNEKEVMSHAA